MRIDFEFFSLLAIIIYQNLFKPERIIYSKILQL